MKTGNFLVFLSLAAVACAQDQPFGGQTIRDNAQADQAMIKLVANSPKRGDAAPDLTLASSDGSEEVKLSQFWKEKPLVLIFGSLTCDVSCEFSREILEIHRRFGEQVQLAYVYVREAHPKDGWVVAPRYSVIDDPKTLAARIAAAARFETLTNYPFPILVDNLEDEAASRFGAWPNRFFVIETDGTIAFAGANGPWGFRPLRDSVYLDMGKGLPYVPKNHERHSLQSYLERRLAVDLVAADRFSGKTVTTMEMIGQVIFSRIENAPLVGESAPDLNLRRADQPGQAALSDFWKEKPAVITFGSVTSEANQAGKDEMRKLHDQFGDRTQFVHVYLRESQPIDGVRHSTLSTIVDPKTIEERMRAAQLFLTQQAFGEPVLVDSMNDEAAIRYSAWPARTIVVDTNGIVVYRGYQGPFRFKPTEAFSLSYADFEAPQMAAQADVVSVEAFLTEFLNSN